MAGTSHGLNALQPELDEYLEFFSASGQQRSRLAKIRDLERVLENILAPRETRGERGVHVELGPSIWLTGRWAEIELSPRLERGAASDTNVLRVKMSQRHTFVASAETFSWLSRRHELRLSDLSFNPEILETLKRTQAQAAAASNYSRQDDHVEIVVTDREGRERRIERIRGQLP